MGILPTILHKDASVATLISYGIRRTFYHTHTDRLAKVIFERRTLMPG